MQRTPLRISEQFSVVSAAWTGQFSAVIDDTAIYVRVRPAPNARLRWVEIPLQELGGDMSLLNVQNEDPAEQASLLSASVHVHLVGRQVVDGVLTSKYTGYFAPSAALAALPSALRSQLAEAISQITGDVHFSLWIGPGHQVKKIRETEKVLGGDRLTLTYVINWLSQPVHITIPRRAIMATLQAGMLG